MQGQRLEIDLVPSCHCQEVLRICELEASAVLLTPWDDVIPAPTFIFSSSQPNFLSGDFMSTISI